MTTNAISEMLIALASKVACQLNLLDFSELWPGFNKCAFAVYTNEAVAIMTLGEEGLYCDERIQVMPWDQRFMGNTAIDFEDGYLAIWHVVKTFKEGNNTLEVDEVHKLTAGIVHEMFHVFQKRSGETRYPNDLELMMWEPSVEVLELKQETLRQLVGAVTHTMESQVLSAVACYVEAREARQSIDAMAYRNEASLECLEGLAEHVAMKALRQMNFDLWQRWFTKHLETCLSTDALLAPRTSAYASGALLFELIERLGLSVHLRSISESADLPYFDQVPWHQIEVLSGFWRKDLVSLVDAVKQKHQRAIMEALENVQRGAGEGAYQKLAARIVGYDPINTVRLGNQMLCNHFVMLQNEGEQDCVTKGMDAPVFYRGPLVLEMRPESANQVVGLYRINV